MKKIKLNDVLGAFPVTVQTAKKINRPKPMRHAKLPAKDYQSDDVNCQQLYKPISKIIRF